MPPKVRTIALPNACQRALVLGDPIAVPVVTVPTCTLPSLITTVRAFTITFAHGTQSAAAVTVALATTRGLAIVNAHACRHTTASACARVGRRLSVLVRPRPSTVPHTRDHAPADAHRQHLLYVHRRARTHERERSDDARRAYAETTKQGPAHSRPHAPRSAPLPAGPHTGSRASGCARTLPPMPTDAPTRTPTRTGALTVTRRHKRRRVSLPGDRGASV